MKDIKDLLCGVNPIVEKLKTTPAEITEIILMRGRQRSLLHGIEFEGRRLGIKISYNSPRVLDQLARGQKHQGVLAWIAPYSYLPFPELEQRLRKSQGTCQVLILDGITDPRNFGALLRTAEAVGIRDVVIPKDRSVGVTPAVAKASAGAIHHIRICRVTNLRRAIAAIKNHGLWIVGLEASAPVELYSRDYPVRLAIVLGSEGQGVRPLIQKECDFLVSIPMRGEISSLNVSVAGAVFLYELLRQRSGIDKTGGKS